MMIKFRESGHPVFRVASPLSQGALKSKAGGKLSIHFCADGDTIETVFRTIIFVNQLSFCRGIISYTSYSRTNDCIYNGYDNINLEPNAMNNIDTVAHMNMHYTQYWAH